MDDDGFTLASPKVSSPVSLRAERDSGRSMRRICWRREHTPRPESRPVDRPRATTTQERGSGKEVSFHYCPVTPLPCKDPNRKDERNETKKREAHVTLSPPDAHRRPCVLAPKKRFGHHREEGRGRTARENTKEKRASGREQAAAAQKISNAQRRPASVSTSDC